MEQTELLVFLIIFSTITFVLRKFVSRGKAKSLDLLKKLVPMIIISGLLLWFIRKNNFNIAPYILLCLVVYTSAYWFIMIYKKRDRGIRYFMWLGVAIPYIIAPYYDGIISGLLLILGGTMSVIVLVYLYKHPYFNAEWLGGIMDEINSQVSRGKYSSKPVVIYCFTGKRFITSSYGLRIIVKNDKFITKMSKKLHERLGHPNLEEFAYILSRKILREQSNIDTKKQNEDCFENTIDFGN